MKSIRRRAAPWLRAAIAAARRRRHDRAFTVLSAVALSANRSLDPAAVIRNALAELVRTLGVQTGTAYLVDDTGQRLSLIAAVGMSEEFVAQSPSLALGEGVSGLVARDGTAIVVEDVATDLRVRRSWLLVQQGIVSAVAVPIPSRRGVEGVMSVGSTVPRRFRDREVRLLEAVAHQVGTALENARLFEAERRTTETLRALHETASAQNARLAQALEIHRRLTQLLLDGATAEAVVETLSSLTGNPAAVLIEGERGKGKGERGSAGERGSTDPLSSFPFPLSPRAAEAIRATGEQRRPGMVPLLVDGREVEAACAPIAAAGEVLGYAIVAAIHRPLGELDVVAAEQAATALALLWLRERAAEEIERRLRGDVVGDLLGGNLGDAPALLDRSARLGHDLTAPHRLFVVRSADGATRQADFDAIIRLLPSVAPGGLAAVWGEGVVILAPLPADAATIAGALASVVAAGATVGDGGICTRLEEYRTAYLHALRALEVHRALGRPAAVASWDELGLYAALGDRLADDGLSGFVDRLLGRLIQYDRKHQAELVRTLEEYFHHNGNLEATASALFIHVNTLKYRLARIGAIGGLNLNDPEQRFQLQLALRLVRLAG